MSLSVGQKISFSYQGSTAYAGQTMSGDAVATGNLIITDGSASGTYNDVTMYYNPNAKGILGTVTGVYYIVANDHTFVNAVNSYVAYDGTFTVSTVINGSGSTDNNTVTENVSFTAVTSDTVVFTESGLPSGTSWSVTLNGQTLSSTSSTITFSNMSSGTYTFTVSAVGYTAIPSSGSVTLP